MLAWIRRARRASDPILAFLFLRVFSVFHDILVKFQPFGLKLCKHNSIYQNYAYKVLAQTVKKGLKYYEKAFSNAQKKARQKHNLLSTVGAGNW